MKTRKAVAILGAGLIFACCIVTYMMLDVIFLPSGHNFKSSVRDVSKLVSKICSKVFIIQDKYYQNVLGIRHNSANNT